MSNKLLRKLAKQARQQQDKQFKPPVMRIKAKGTKYRIRMVIEVKAERGKPHISRGL